MVSLVQCLVEIKIASVRNNGIARKRIECHERNCYIAA